MAEPHASMATGAAVGLGTALLGAQVDALAVGLVAATFMAIWMEAIDDKLKAAGVKNVICVIHEAGNVGLVDIGALDQVVQVVVARRVGYAVVITDHLRHKTSSGK